MLALILKTLHILSAVVFLGTGLGSAWYKLRADRSGDLRVIAWAQSEIVFADLVFTIPSAIALPATGIGLALHYGLPLSVPWVMWGIILYIVAGVCWLPAVWAQYRMKVLTREAIEAGATDASELPEEFHRYNKLWLVMGFPSFAAAMLTIWIMTAKYVFWA